MLNAFTHLLPDRALHLRLPVTSGEQFPQSHIRADRLGAVDIVRGLAMIFMLLNHATWHVPGISFRVNFGWDVPLPPLPFFNPVMWVGLLQGTPTFFIMAGFSVALFEYSRRRKGWTEWQMTRFLLIRGAVLIIIDWLVMPLQFYPQPGYEPNIYYVLTTIGICLWFVALIRLLSTPAILTGIVVITLIVQAVYDSVILPLDVDLLRAVFLYMTPLDPIKFGFPVMPWLCMILLGYTTMRYLNTHPEHFARVTLGVAIIAWAAWIIVNHFNGFGILFPFHPLLMTKHPPDLAYLTFYAAATYSLLYLLHLGRLIHERFPFNRIALLGQTALIFYILHFYAIDIFSALLHDLELHPFLIVLLITGLSLLLLYVVCTRYHQFRKAHPDSLLRYL